MRKYRGSHKTGVCVEDIATALIDNGNLPEECRDDLIEILYQLETHARNDYNADCWRTLYNALVEVTLKEWGD